MYKAVVRYGMILTFKRHVQFRCILKMSLLYRYLKI